MNKQDNCEKIKKSRKKKYSLMNAFKQRSEIEIVSQYHIYGNNENKKELLH